MAVKTVPLKVMPTWPVPVLEDVVRIVGQAGDENIDEEEEFPEACCCTADLLHIKPEVVSVYFRFHEIEEL